MHLGTVSGTATLVAVSLVLSGCVAVPPPGMSAPDLAAFNERVLDETWARSGLDGEVERPAAREAPALTERDWFDAMGACMAEGGVTSFGTAYSTTTGFELVNADGTSSSSQDDLLLFYGCVSRHPMIPGDSFEALTDAQLNYIYDYYQTTLVPCMIMNGFTPSTAPSRVEFLALAGQWNPYYSVDVGISGIQYEELERICGPQRPELY